MDPKYQTTLPPECMNDAIIEGKLAKGESVCSDSYFKVGQPVRNVFCEIRVVGKSLYLVFSGGGRD